MGGRRSECVNQDGITSGRLIPGHLNNGVSDDIPNNLAVENYLAVKALDGVVGFIAQNANEAAIMEAAHAKGLYINCTGVRSVIDKGTEYKMMTFADSGSRDIALKDITEVAANVSLRD